MTPAIPDALGGGRYTIGPPLGAGGMAVVHQAFDRELRVERAVKILLPGHGATTIRKRLRTEATAMARLRHPNILGVHDIGTDGPFDWIVMDLAPGGSLQQRVSASGPLALGEALGTMVKVLSALATAHAAGIVHRDVKPHNILLDADGQPLLADFGIAMLGEGDRSTRTGVAMGSLAFMSPEQRLDAAHVGPPADIYACGATLFALLTNDNPVDLFLAGPDSERWHGVPREVRAVVQRACAPHASDRYPDAPALAQALLEVLEQLPTDVRDQALAGRGFFPPPSRTSDATARPAPLAQRPTHATPFDATLVRPAAAAPARGNRRTTSALVAVGACVGLAAWWVTRDPPAVAEAPAAEGPAADMPAAEAPAAEGPAAEGPAAEGPAAEEPGAEEPPAVEAPAEAGRAEAAPAAQAPSRAEKAGGSPPSPAPPSNACVASGAWAGSLNGRVVELELAGTDAALTGRFTTRWAGKVDSKPVVGRFEPSSGALALEDAVDGTDTGRYLLRLHEGRLDGTFHRHAGGSVPMSLTRSPG